MNIIFSIPVLVFMVGFILTLNKKKVDPFWRDSQGRFTKKQTITYSELRRLNGLHD